MKKGIGIGKNLYYEEEFGNFYWVKQTPKTIFIEWIPHLSCDGSELDQNVKYKELIIKKDNSGKHCLKENNENEILIYPYRSGMPFYLEPAKIKHINKEIDICEKWGISPQYYKNLRIFTW
jgi:hypothetical protein